jgi:hypothetical protein
MVISSFVALNMIEAQGMMELKSFISESLDSSIKPVDVVQPVGLHFCIQDKLFVGTNQRFIQCPIHFLLRDRTTPATQVCRPIWGTDSSERSKVNRKAKSGVKKHSVIRLDEFSVVRHQPAAGGYVLLIRSYHVVKKDVDQQAYDRWIMD